MDVDGDEFESPEAREVRELKVSLGLEPGRAPPSRTFAGDASKPFAVKNWQVRTRKHLVAVLAGRGDAGVEQDGIENVVAALDRLGYLERLIDSKGFQKFASPSLRS